MLSTILIVVLILLLIGALPTWPYSAGWGYYPGGGLGLILIIVVILALSGRIRLPDPSLLRIIAGNGATKQSRATSHGLLRSAHNDENLSE